jgi:hypothetical protein
MADLERDRLIRIIGGVVTPEVVARYMVITIDEAKALLKQLGYEAGDSLWYGPEVTTPALSSGAVILNSGYRGKRVGRQGRVPRKPGAL